MEEREETFTITVENGRVGLEGEYRYLDRAKDTGDLIARFSKHIGDVKLSFTRHDQPACQLGWNHKERMVELAGMGDCKWGLGGLGRAGADLASRWQTLDLPTTSKMAMRSSPTGRTDALPNRLSAKSSSQHSRKEETRSSRRRTPSSSPTRPPT